MKKLSQFLLVLALVLFAANAEATKKTLLKVQVYAGTHLVGLGSTPKWLAEHLKKASGNTLRLKLYEPGKLVPGNAILRAVDKGQLDAGYATAGNAAGILGNKSAIFSAVPFGPDAPEMLAWLYHGDGRKLWQEMYDKAGIQVHSIPCGIIAPETSGWFPRPIDKPEDLKGLRMRFFGLGALVMEKLGVSTSVLSAKEIFPALEKGAIDATEFSMPAIDELLGFHKILKYNYFPGWHQPATVLELVVNKKKWAKLGKSHQALLELGCKAAMLDGFALGEAIQAAVMKRNIEKRGVKNRYWSAEMLALFRKTWDGVLAEQKAKDPEFTRIWDNLAAFRAQYRVWNNWAFLPRPGTRRIEDK